MDQIYGKLFMHIFQLGDNQYEKFKYPAGEIQVRLKVKLNPEEAIKLIARIQSAEDFMETALLMDAINGVTLSVTPKTLLLPYFPYGRADRRFVDGDCSGLDVFARMLHSIPNWAVHTLDPHSNATLNWAKELSPMPFIRRAIYHFSKSEDIVVLLPDKGAHERYNAIIKGFDHRVKILSCNKIRDPKTGKLSGFSVPKTEDLTDQSGEPYPILIVDDICDGGRTFIGIAEQLAGYDLGLYVTHGIFSKGVDELFKYFSEIYTTDSICKESPTKSCHFYVFEYVEELLKVS